MPSNAPARRSHAPSRRGKLVLAFAIAACLLDPICGSDASIRTAASKTGAIGPGSLAPYLALPDWMRHAPASGAALVASPGPALPNAAIALIRGWESRLLRARRDAVGRLTVGYGHTGGVRRGMRITKSMADEMFADDLARAERDVRRSVQVPLNGNEYGALVSLAFNIGGAAFARSQLLAALNADDRLGAAAAFVRYSHARIGRRAVALRGLALRRDSERILFATPAADGRCVTRGRPA